jgi:hypothetical protein
MPAPSKRAKQQAAKLQAGLLAGKGAPRNGDAGDAGAVLQEAAEHAPSPAEPAKAVKATLKADDIFYGKGAATAATFRPWYWSYDEKTGGPEDTPAHDAGAAPAKAEAPPADASADAKILQERLAEKATAMLGTAPPPAVEAAAPAALAAPAVEDAAPPQTVPTPENGVSDPRVALAAEPALAEAQAGAPVSVEPAVVEAMAVETPAAEPSPAEPTIIEVISAEPAPVEALDAEPAPVEPTIIESPSIAAAEPVPVEATVIESMSVEAPAAESLPVETPVVAAQPEPALEAPEPVPEARQERPHQRARRSLREQATAAEVVAPPPPVPAKRRKAASAESDDAAALAAEEHAATLADEERVAALAAEERAVALVEEARAAVVAEEERLAAARAAADAAPASSDDLAATIESALSRRRYTDPIDLEKAPRSASGHTITGNSLLAELQAARQARGNADSGVVREVDAPASTASSRPLLDRVLAFGGIALILVVAVLALSPAAQYAPVARLTHLFN